MHLSSLQIVRFSQFIVPRVVVVLDSDLLHALFGDAFLFVCFVVASFLFHSVFSIVRGKEKCLPK